MASFDKYWLPEGYHWHLHIEHDRLPDAGGFTGGGKKLVWHCTQSKWWAIDAMVDTLREKDAAPHFVIGGRVGLDAPVVVQLLPLNVAGRALQNNAGDGYQTNRANAWQVEICAFAEDMGQFPDLRMRALANLFELVTHRVAIPNVAPQDFSKAQRMSDAAWVKAEGHVGHSMAPDNDHVDPGHFREGTLIQMVDRIPDGGYSLVA